MTTSSLRLSAAPDNVALARLKMVLGSLHEMYPSLERVRVFMGEKPYWQRSIDISRDVELMEKRRLNQVVLERWFYLKAQPGFEVVWEERRYTEE
jgi:hypothetical protein